MLGFSIVKEVRFQHSWKAHSPMAVTEFGMVTEVSLVQFSKVLSPM